MKGLLVYLIAVACFSAIGQDPTSPLVLTDIAYSVSNDCAIIGLGDPKKTAVDREIVGDVAIPDTIDGHKVIAINDFAFRECSKITSMIIPYGVTRIGKQAFFGCRAMTAISLPATITEIDESAFSTTGLLSVEIPNGVSSVRCALFNCCKSLSSVGLPSSVLSIDDMAFASCEALKAIELPDHLRSIGTSAFEGCKSLRVIDMPDSVVSIGGGVCINCSNLSSVSLSQNLVEIPSRAFNGCESLSAIDIPQKVTHIGEYAFAGTKFDKDITVGLVIQSEWVLSCHGNPKSVDLRGGIRGIADRAFYSSCGLLESITIPDGVKWIGREAFASCQSLKEVVLPDSVQNIEEALFESCYRLQRAVLPRMINTFYSATFRDCYLLESISMPESVAVWVGASLFENCRSLKTVSLPNNISKIEQKMFKGCSQLESIIVPEGVKRIGNEAYCGCAALKNIVFPRSVTKLGDDIFKGCSSLAVVCFNGKAPEYDTSPFFVGTADELVILVRPGTTGWESPGTETTTLPAMWPPTSSYRRSLKPLTAFVDACPWSENPVVVSGDVVNFVSLVSGTRLIVAGQTLPKIEVVSYGNDGTSYDITKFTALNAARTEAGAVAFSPELDKDKVSIDDTLSDVLGCNALDVFVSAEAGDVVPVSLPSAKAGLYYKLAVSSEITSLSTKMASTKGVLATDEGAIINVKKPKGDSAFFMLKACAGACE